MCSFVEVYERSIIKAVVPKDDINTRVLTTCSRTDYLPPMTYKWLSELHFRQKAVSSMCHDLWNIEKTQGLSNFRSSDPQILMSRETALQTMYELVDCTVGIKLEYNVRAKQGHFLEDLTMLELGLLGVFSKALAVASLSRVGDGLFRDCPCGFEDIVSFLYVSLFMRHLLTSNIACAVRASRISVCFRGQSKLPACLIAYETCTYFCLALAVRAIYGLGSYQYVY